MNILFSKHSYLLAYNEKCGLIVVRTKQREWLCWSLPINRKGEGMDLVRMEVYPVIKGHWRIDTLLLVLELNRFSRYEGFVFNHTWGKGQYPGMEVKRAGIKRSANDALEDARKLARQMADFSDYEQATISDSLKGKFTKQKEMTTPKVKKSSKRT
jgi:hypothetical protein